MAFGEVPKRGFETLPHSSSRLVGHETLRRTNRIVRLHIPEVVERPYGEVHSESLARKVIAKLGVDRLMRGDSARG